MLEFFKDIKFKKKQKLKKYGDLNDFAVVLSTNISNQPMELIQLKFFSYLKSFYLWRLLEGKIYLVQM